MSKLVKRRKAGLSSPTATVNHRNCHQAPPFRLLRQATEELMRRSMTTFSLRKVSWICRLLPFHLPISSLPLKTGGEIGQLFRSAGGPIGFVEASIWDGMKKVGLDVFELIVAGLDQVANGLNQMADGLDSIIDGVDLVDAGPKLGLSLDYGLRLGLFISPIGVNDSFRCEELSVDGDEKVMVGSCYVGRGNRLGDTCPSGEPLNVF